MDTAFLSNVDAKMQKALNFLREDLSSIRTGRASAALVENIMISAYENTQQLRVREMATITTDGPRTIVIAPFDPSVIRDLEKGINTSNRGFSAAVDGNILRITIPPLTGERREEYIKLAHTKVENGKVMIRQVRHEAMTDIKKKSEAKEINEDDKKRLEKEIQTITDRITGEIDSMREKKEQELREV